MSELKPVSCRCGGESHIDHIYIDVPTEYGTFIEMPLYGCFCTKCGIRLPFKHISADAAIDEWNAIMGVRGMPTAQYVAADWSGNE